LESLDEFFKGLLSNAHAYSYYQKPITQGRLKRFSYIGVFETAEEHIIVYSVIMTGQDLSRNFASSSKSLKFLNELQKGELNTLGLLVAQDLVESEPGLWIFQLFCF
jgi:hypothetical protein